MPWPIGIRILWGLNRALIAVEILQYLRDLYGSDADDEQPTLAVRRAQIRLTRPAAVPATADDVMVVTLDLLKMDSGSFSDDWTNQNFLDAEAQIEAIWAEMKKYATAGTVLSEIRWYRKVPGTGVVGPPRRISAKNIPGTGAVFGNPPQVAVTVTERTALRKHWGRLYWPMHAGNAVSDGRLAATPRAAIAAAHQAAYRALVTAGLIPVVVSDTMRAALQVREVQVDDVLDIQRSRRFRSTLARSRLTTEPA